MSVQNIVLVPDQGLEADNVDEDVDADVYDEEEEEDKRVNLQMFGIHQALPIPDGEPDWDSGPPETAEEYLRRVRFEAAACPRVVRVEFDAEAHAAKQRKRAAQQLSRGGTPEPSSPTTAATSEASGITVSTRRVSGSAHAGPPVASYVARLIAAGTLHEGPDWAQPSLQWVREMVTDFRSMRQWLVENSEQHAQQVCNVRMPHIHDVAAWDRICFGSRPGTLMATTLAAVALQDSLPASLLTPQTVSSTAALHLSAPNHDAPKEQQGTVSSSQCDEGASSVDIKFQGDGSGVVSHVSRKRGGAEALGEASGAAVGMPRLSGPVLSTVLCLDQVAVGVLLQRCVAHVEAAESLTETDAHWLFALAAVLEKPAHSDVVATLRSLTRCVLRLRGGLQNASDAQLPRLNTLAVVAGAYFGQDEKLLQYVSDLDLP